MGDAVVADVRFTLEALLEELHDFTPEREAPEARPDPEPVPVGENPMSPSEAAQALADVWPDDGIAVVESPSATLAIRNRLRLSRPGSW